MINSSNHNNTFMAERSQLGEQVFITKKIENQGKQNEIHNLGRPVLESG